MDGATAGIWTGRGSPSLSLAIIGIGGGEDEVSSKTSSLMCSLPSLENSSTGARDGKWN